MHTKYVCGFFLTWVRSYQNQCHYAQFHILGCPYTAALTIVISYTVQKLNHWWLDNYTCYMFYCACLLITDL